MTAIPSATALAAPAAVPPVRPDLTAAETIQRLYATDYSRVYQEREREQGLAAFAAMLRSVGNASLREFATPEFQRRLWEDNPVASSGASSVSMRAVIEDRALAEWLAQAAKTPLPARGPERLQALEKLYTDLCERVRPLVDRMPWLRILRVMATLFPEDYCNVPSETHLRTVARALFGRLPKTTRESSMTVLNARILDRLTEVLGPPEGTPEALARRGEFVWFLWETLRGGRAAESPGEADAEEPLVFPPVTRRLKGLSPIPDPVSTIVETLEFVSRNRPTRRGVVDFILSAYPSIQKTSAAQYVNCMWNTFGLLQLNGELVELTAAGRAFLDSENPDILVHPLVTKAIGPDVVLWRLRQRGPTPRSELLKALQDHYRRWTTLFMPNAILAWGRSFDLWAAAPDGKYALTERGRKWADRLAAEPLPVATVVEPEGGAEEEEERAVPPFLAPALPELLDVFRRGPLVIPEEAVIRLHAALHASQRKHFVLLSGLSGTGKTQLALAYANAYHRLPLGSPNPCLCLISVQPDWTDATGLLGYVNPLGSEASYVRTECLKFLLAAHERPAVPHFLCLDEMNLARVEYYFAPFLSAMETGGRLVFHHEDQALDNVPPFIPWPENLFILGTVNMDETTHAFSDKVLDRAFTIEFWDVALEQYAQRFARDERHRDYPPDLLQEAIRTLRKAADILVAVHQHFGYRTAGEVLGFLRACEGHLDRTQALDQALFMKVLPKIRGQDTEAMRKVLEDLGAWAAQRGFGVTANKVRAMVAELRDTGTTRFWR